LKHFDQFRGVSTIFQIIFTKNKNAVRRNPSFLAMFLEYFLTFSYGYKASSSSLIDVYDRFYDRL